MYEIGDIVAVLDDDLSGKIIRIKSNKITIETVDGFELDFESKEIVKLKDDFSPSEIFNSKSFHSVLAEKSDKQKHSFVKTKSKERYLPTMEVDLHLKHLVKNENHLTSHDKKNIQLDTAKHKLEYAIKQKIQKIVFIHGVGEGVLKMELEYLFNRYDNIKFYDAEYKKYGFGDTEVYIFQNKN
ncbi:DNA mismatch repair protein MutS [Aurantibacter sp.]|uniref:DNA mismatch repair protein MutS n=1 Tax=Aurantibacter sp. TaxID=2807103 RepID=UPI0035C80E9B